MSMQLFSLNLGTTGSSGGGVADGKNIRTTRFISISSGTSGTVTLPPSSTVVLDDFGGTVDAVVTTITGGKPNTVHAVTAGGTVVSTTFDASGNWVFSGTPSAYPVAIVYRVQQLLANFDDTSSSIWGEVDAFPVGVGSGTPGGLNTQLQYNNSGAFAGDTAVTDGSGNLSATSIALGSLTASRAVVSDGSKFLISSATTATELAFVSGVTSAIQTQLNGKQAGSNIYYFGDGSDGNVTISTAVTLTRDMFYNNLTLTAGCVLKPASFRIFVSGTLDISNAPTGAIQMTGGNGGAGVVTGAGGAAGTALATGSGIFTSTVAVAGSAGGVAAGTAGGGGGTGNGIEGGGTAASGAGGAGSGGAGGASGAGVAPLVPVSIRKFDTVFFGLVGGAFTPFRGGGGCASGGGGGGGGATTGGGGGGGGPAGGIVYISAATIARGTNTNPGIIQCKGGNGGAGATPSGANSGGGGGGSGGAGGWIFLAWGALTGSTITGAIDVSGGAGGTGGSASAGGVAGGAGGGAGGSGRASLIDLAAGASTESAPTNGISGSAQSAGVGGAGASAQIMQVNL